MKDYRLASLSKRLIALLIDCIIFYLLLLFFSFILGEFNSLRSFKVSGFPAIVLFGIGIYLTVFSEALEGQTIGKKLMSIKVVNLHGREIRTKQAFLRYIFGIIDLFFGIGIVVVILNSKNQRLGDLIAKTLVVEV